ncbi:unnamed protein product [Nezara viridula]|uniref:Uncharacterized protein n=1 Tax=Nezara viridula TaxID=85310 RepID=A0A9P0MND9_NEZVI|nr:unnamed protein product [Nezara viridula]
MVNSSDVPVSAFDDSSYYLGKYDLREIQQKSPGVFAPDFEGGSYFIDGSYFPGKCYLKEVQQDFPGVYAPPRTSTTLQYAIIHSLAYELELDISLELDGIRIMSL